MRAEAGCPGTLKRLPVSVTVVPSTFRIEKSSVTAEIVVTSSRFAVGAQVAHEQFGVGCVVNVRDDKLTIKFEKGKIKEIGADFVRAVKK